MKNCIGIVIFLFAALALNAQDINISKQNLVNDLTYLAGASCVGRGSDQEGILAAAKFIEDRLENLGIPAFQGATQNQEFLKGYRQNVPLKKEIINAVDLRISDDAFNYKNQFWVNTGYTETSIAAKDLVFVGYGINAKGFNELEGDLTNKVIVVLEGEPTSSDGKSLIDPEKNQSVWGQSISFKLSAVSAKNPAAILVITKNFKNIAQLYQYRAEHPQIKLNIPVDSSATFFITQNPVIPTFFMNEKMSAKVLKLLRISEKKVLKSYRKQLKPIRKTVKENFNASISRTIDTFESPNIMAFLPGSDLSQEVLVVSAHYDHLGIEGEEIYYGADDNGTGTVALLALAQAYVENIKKGKRPKRSILFLWVTAEEKGLLGSNFFTEKPPFEINNIVANLNIDMIGRTDKAHENNSKYIYIIGGDRTSLDLHNLNEQANAESVNIELDYTFNDPKDPNRYYYRSDHYNFVKNGIPAIFYFSGIHDDYHKPTDTVDKIDFDKMKTIIELVYRTSWMIVNRPDRIVSDLPDGGE